MEEIRTGIGYDIHRTRQGVGLYIGGVKVSTEMEFIAHSDGDVLIHAIIDALLGAAGEKDIGELFPDSDPEFRNISSLDLLSRVKNRLAEKNIEIVNIDSVIILEFPKLAPFKADIKRAVCGCLDIPDDSFNLKAKSRENIDAVGRGEAIECFCSSLIKISDS